jgi:CheY-like chemotaxis protein
MLKQVERALPGFETTGVNSAEAALEFVDRRGQMEAACIAHQLPGMSGIELTHTLRGRGFSAPIVVTLPDLRLRELAEAAGADRCVSSVEFKDMLEALQSVLSDRQLLFTNIGN